MYLLNQECHSFWRDVKKYYDGNILGFSHLLLNKVQFLENFIMHPARPKAGHYLRLLMGEAGQVACMLRTLYLNI